MTEATQVSDHLAYARDLGSWPEDSELVGIQGPLSVWEEDGKKHASARCSWFYENLT